MKIGVKERRKYRKDRRTNKKVNKKMEVDYILNNSSVVVASHFGCENIVKGDKIILSLMGVQIATFDHNFKLVDVAFELHNKTVLSSSDFKELITPELIEAMVEPSTMRVRHGYYS